MADFGIETLTTTDTSSQNLKVKTEAGYKLKRVVTDKVGEEGLLGEALIPIEGLTTMMIDS